MFAAPEVVAFLFARVAGKTRLGNLFGRFIFERDDLRRVTFCHVGLAWSMTRLATCHFLFPTVDFGETGVRSMRERFELILVTVFASLAADVVIVGRRRRRSVNRGNAPDRCDCRSAKNNQLDRSEEFQDSGLLLDQDLETRTGWKTLVICTGIREDL
jgi:hypothetical protein